MLPMPDNQFINLGVGNSFGAQQQQAQNSELISDEQAKMLLDLMDPTESFAYSKAAADAAGASPQLHFDGNTFAEGVGNGISNYYAMKGYKQQQQGYSDIIQQQQAYQQQQLKAANDHIRAEQARRLAAANVIPDPLRKYYQAMGPDAQDKYLGEVGTKEISTTYKPIESAAESKAKIAGDQDKLNWQRERFHALTGVFPEQAFSMGNQGALTPQMQSAWKYVYDADPPKDALDFKERFAKTASTVEGARGATIDNQTRGQRNQAGLDSTLLRNSIEQVNLKYAGAMKQADKLLAEGKVEDAQKLRTNLDEGRKRFDQAVQKYDHMTDGEVALFNAQMKAIGLPYILPGKGKLSAVKKDGKVTQFYDPYTGKVTAPDKQ